MKLYMHTINDEPAEFMDGSICFAPHRVKGFAKSLKQIRKEQRIDKKELQERGVNVPCYSLGHRLLYIPDKEIAPSP